MEFPRSALDRVPPTRAKAPLPLALACLLALAASGCVFPDTPDRPWYEEADPAVLLSALADVTARADNYTLDLGFGPSDPDRSDASETLLSYEVSDSPSAVRATLDFAGSTELVVVYPEDGEALVHDADGHLAAPTAWVRGDAVVPDPAPTEVFDLDTLPDVVGLLAGMEGVERGPVASAEETGTLSLNGVLPGLGEGTALGGRSAVAPLLGEDATGALDVSVWVDAEGFPVRMESTSSGGFALWLEFSDWDGTTFHIPNGDEVSEPVRP